MRCPAHGLYAIADTQAIRPAHLPRFAEAVLRGGAVLLQYRDKQGDFRQRTRRGTTLLEVCRTYGVPLIINDDPELCLQIGADGVHLGRTDPAPARARELLGTSALIGLSCYADFERAVAAQDAVLDYVAFGGFFFSVSKPHAVRATTHLLRRARRRLALPIAAIGGITAANGAPLLAAGAGLLAVISDLVKADPEQAAAAYHELFTSAAAQSSGSPAPG